MRKVGVTACADDASPRRPARAARPGLAARAGRSLFPGRYACIALGSFLLGVAAVATLPLGPAADSWWRSLFGVVCSFIGMGVMIVAPSRVAFPLGWRRHPAWRRFAFAATLALAAATIILYAGESADLLGAPSRAYRSDVVAFTDVNARLALAGRNPYTADGAFGTALRRFPAALGTPSRRGAFAGRRDYPPLAEVYAAQRRYARSPRASRGAFDPRVLHSYPALSFLLYAPLLWAGVDNILTLNVAVFWGLFAWLVWLTPIGRRRWSALVGLTAILATGGSTLIGTDVICVAFVLAAWHVRQRLWLSAALLGLGCAFKQYCWFFVPFFVLELALTRPRTHVLRYGAIALAAFLVPNAPYILASPGAWLRSLWLPMDASLFPYGMGIVALSTGHLLPYGPPPFYGVLEALALGVCVWAAARWRDYLRAYTPLLALVPLLFASRSRSPPTSPSRRDWPYMA